MINKFWEVIKRASIEILPVIAVFLTMVVITSIFFKVSKPSSKDIYPEFKSAIIQVLADNSKIDIDESLLILDALSATQSENLSSNNSLRSYLVKIHYDIVSSKDDAKQKAETRKLWGDNLKEIIAKIDEVSPFQRLHPIEASIFQDISALNEKPELDRKLRQLSNLVQARFEELEESKTEARWSLIFGIAGVVGAIVSIFISVFQSFRKPNKQIN
jgi:hypothetical protein